MKQMLSKGKIHQKQIDLKALERKFFNRISFFPTSLCKGKNEEKEKQKCLLDARKTLELEKRVYINICVKGINDFYF